MRLTDSFLRDKINYIIDLKITYWRHIGHAETKTKTTNSASIIVQQAIDD